MPEKNDGGYVSIAGAGEARLEIKHSVFISHAQPVKSDDEAREFIRRMRHEYADATHNCYAYIIKEGNFSRYSDDGEPGGTAGLPIMNVIKGRDITDTAVVVTRYFGGILLGTGGLVRAYTDSASAAIEAARPVLYSPYELFLVTASYSDYQKILYEISKFDTVVDDTSFCERVSLSIAVKKSADEPLLEPVVMRITEITAGRAEISHIGERFGA